MQIPEKLIQEWKALREFRDGVNILKGYKGLRAIYKSDISKAWAYKKAPEHVVAAMTEFYARKKLLKKR
jgi:hypothetical protein